MARTGPETKSRMTDAERYRAAALDALEQIDWAVGYLHQIRKPELARALAKNRSSIMRRLLGRE